MQMILLELSLTEMHIRGMMEHIDLQEGQKLKIEEENIISMIMIEMGIIGMIEILGMTGMKEMIGMIGIGFKNHKGMSSRNLTRMLGRR
jgi:hypothetical protein